jgi:histidine ammonia-lyase
MSLPLVQLDGDTLTLEDIRRVSRNQARVALSGAATARVRASRELVDRVAAGDAPSYGINTGFGTLAEVRIDKKDLQTLQRNLIVSHAAGVGHPLSIPEARALLASVTAQEAEPSSPLNQWSLGLLWKAG